MALDPRTPVLVGVGQVTNRPDPAVPLDLRPDPFALMADALRAAAADCTGNPPDAPSPSGSKLLRRAGSLAIVGGIGWRRANPGKFVAEELGIEPAEHVLSATGGNMPMSLLHRAARMIAEGRVDVALVAGAECLHTRRLARRQDVPLSWRWQEPGSVPAPFTFGADREPATDVETARGVLLPIHAYPLLENAFRAARGWSLEEHRSRIGRLWSRFSEVASDNPYAWLLRPLTPDEIMTPAADNRMVAFPYTKLCNANLNVDQSAALICCSVGAARSARVPEDRWVFPLAGAEAADHWFLSERPHLAESPAIRLCGRRALELAGIGADDLGPVDLYSCFPVAVELAAAELGLSTDDPGRALTVTGGLTFGGGPGNDYTTHGIASLAGRLRQAPGTTGLATGLGWYATKHAIGLFASRPPAHEGAPYRWVDVQGSIDRLPRCPVDEQATGAVTVETYTVTYDRDGHPDRGIVACRTPAGARTWANVTDPAEVAAMTLDEIIGRAGVLGDDRVLALSPA